MTKTYAWTTAKDAEIVATITTEHITRETVDADGFKVEVNCSRYDYSVDAMTVNGNPTDLKELWTERGVNCILIAYRGKNRILVAIPDDIAAEIYGEERAEAAAKLERSIAAEAAYNAHREMMRRAMDD